MNNSFENLNILRYRQDENDYGGISTLFQSP